MDLNTPRVQRYCQTREESCLQNLVDALPGVPRYVVDLGAGDGHRYSNSQLLIDDHGWAACRLDYNTSGRAAVDHTLHEHEITRDNIGALLQQYSVPAQPGLLCIDLDGMDLYVLHAALRAVQPWIVLFEFNGARDPAGCDVIPYNAAHRYKGDDYYGASWGAFAWLLGRHGYCCVHHHDSLNGYAVAGAHLPNTLTAVAPPQQQQWHIHRAGGIWIDAREEQWLRA